ncbi:MAG: hypothetical protein EA384_08230 [Spirochaetaceae bacterium]|nr:MAG: hypothetical protein EA384_08230 [Spirochaetaceae bacterium]
MAVADELINLIITFAFVLAPLWILMSRRRRMQQERRERAETPPPGQRQSGSRPAKPPVAPQPRQPETAKGDDYRDRTRDDQSYKREQGKRSHPESVADAPRPREPGRLEKMLRELLGVPEEEVLRRRKQAREEERRREIERRRAQREARQRAELKGRRREPEVPVHADVKIRAVMAESRSLSLSPGGMGPQHMRTAAGNLSSTSSAEKRPPATADLGRGWQRIRRLPDFKRAVLIAELLGKPHSLKDESQF